MFIKAPAGFLRKSVKLRIDVAQGVRVIADVENQ